MKQVKSRYNYDSSQPLSKEYQDAQVFNAYYKCLDSQTNSHFLLSHFKTQNKTQIASLMKKFAYIQSKMQQGLNCKYLTKIHDVFISDKDKSLFLITDYCDGGSIMEYIGKVYTLEPQTAIRIILGALNGLQELHKYDILNCFINLENIEIDQSGQPKLSFKCMIYKTIYLSPEFRKQHTKSRQSDLYCLGVCLYRLIFGIFPFKTQKNEELIQLVKKGPALSVEKDRGLFSIKCVPTIKAIILDLLSIDPEQRTKAIQKMQQFSAYLSQPSLLSQQVYLKFFKSKYINIFTHNDQTQENQSSVLDPKQKKLLKLLIYNAPKHQIEGYLKNVISKFAKLSGESFVKIYEYQIIQENYLALVYSYNGEGTLAEYRKNLEQGFTAKQIEGTSQFLKRSLKMLETPYKYLNNERICIKNGNLRIKFPEFQTKKFTQNLKQMASSGSTHFVAPQILSEQQSKTCDSWSIGVIEYWMSFNELPELDSKGTLILNKKQKLSRNKLLYFHNVIEKNPNSRLNLLDDQEVQNKLNFDPSILENEFPKKVSGVDSQDLREGSPSRPSNGRQQNRKEYSPVRGTTVKLQEPAEQCFPQLSAVSPSKIKRNKKKELAAIESSPLNPNILPNTIEYEKVQGSRYKNPILIESKQPIPNKNPNKFDMKMFNQPQEIKTPQQILPIQKPTINQQQSDTIIEQLGEYIVRIRSRFATLEKSYTKSIRISVKCLIVIVVYLFLFYFNFFRVSSALIGSRETYETKTVLIRAFPTDSVPSINYTLVTKTPTETNLLFYNTTVPVLRDQYKCVLNDYSVKSNVAEIIRSEGFVAYQVFGFLIALFNILMVCVVIARFDLCRACSITNFDEKQYHPLINYGAVLLSVFSLTSLHYLIYGGLYHLRLEPCLGKSTLPGLEFLMKNWVGSWVLRFIWIYIGIVIAYVLIIFLLIKPLKQLNSYIYIAILVLYFIGVGVRGMGKSYPAHQNVFGVCGELLGLLVALFLFFTDMMFACFTKSKSHEKNQNNIDTRSIEDFNKTEEFFIGNQANDDYDEK